MGSRSQPLMVYPTARAVIRSTWLPIRYLHPTHGKSWSGGTSVGRRMSSSWAKLFETATAVCYLGTFIIKKIKLIKRDAWTGSLTDLYCQSAKLWEIKVHWLIIMFPIRTAIRTKARRSCSCSYVKLRRKQNYTKSKSKYSGKVSRLRKVIRWLSNKLESARTDS